MHNAWLLLGSNIQPAHHLVLAVRMISPDAKIKAISSVWQSSAFDRPDQPDYWNAAILLETEREPEDLLRNLMQPIESKLGRKRTDDKWAARTIDIDLMLFDSLVGTYAGKLLPHPDILLRPYAAIPLAEISPDVIHPTAKISLQQIADKVSGNLTVQKVDFNLINQATE